MRRFLCLAFIFASLATAFASDKNKPGPDWKIGHVMDESKAREFAGIYHSGQSTTSTNGSVSATANTNSYGNNSTTNINGDYSGRSSTSSSGFDTPMYRVYDNVIVEGDDLIYVTSERLIWRWSKGPRVTVNGEVKYYVDGTKLHLIDDTGKERTIGIVRVVKKAPPAPAPIERPVAEISTGVPSGLVSTLTITSTPTGADIEIDGNFVGNTPSSITTPTGAHLVRITKNGYEPWERQMRSSNGAVTISPELQPLNGAASK